MKHTTPEEDKVAELANRFAYHPPSTDAVREAHEEVRLAASLFASMVNVLVPPGREQSLAFTKIEEAMFWANGGIARDPDNCAPVIEDTELPRIKPEYVAQTKVYMDPDHQAD